MPFERLKRGVAQLAFGALCSCTACAPTLSKPRGEAHLNALSTAEGHQHHGRYAQAVEAYGQAAKTAERRVDRDEALYRQSRVFARMGDLPNAIRVCDELGAAEPIARRTLRARLDAAKYRLRLGEHERAERDLYTLITDYPESAAAKSALRTMMQLHVEGAPNHEEALAWVRTLEPKVKGKPIEETLLSTEAEQLISLGQREQAVALLEQQIELYPYPQGTRWDDALWRLADLALDAKDPKRAVAYLEKMISVHETSIVIGSYTRPMFSKAALRIARIYRDELHDPEAAIDAYEHMRKEFPRSLGVDDALEEEAELRLAQGEKDKGCDLLHELVEEHEVGSARKHAEQQIATHCAAQ